MNLNRFAGYIGILDHRNLVTARYLRAEAHPTTLVDQVRRIWATGAHRDTNTLVTQILAHDWDHLDAAATIPPDRHGRHLVPGIGIAFTDGDPQPCAFPLAHAGFLDADFVYVIDPQTHTVTVHTDDGQPAGTHPLSIHRPERHPR